MKHKNIQYKNGTAFFAVVKQTNGSTFELLPGMQVKADPGNFFVKVKYPAVSKKWFKL
jgi:hypothetical protein